jgi:hypothetical protein
MFDLILLFFTIGVFYAGFWSGGRYKTLREMFNALVGYIGGSPGK